MLTYCRRCVMPDTMPGIVFDDEGVCGACRSYEKRAGIDWNARREQLVEIFDDYRSATQDKYDCIVPVSGGKDSTYQVLKVLEYNMTPICVIASTDMLTDIGRRNIENLKGLGVDVIEVSVNPKVRRIINRMTLVEYGDNIEAEHATIFTVPVRMAVAMKIPLIVWGENSQDEVGGDESLYGGSMTYEYFQEATHGFDPESLLGVQGIRLRDLIQYTYPPDAAMLDVGVTGIFLGHYLPWNGRDNALIAQTHGLTTYPTAVEGSVVNYENLDNAYTGIHDYLMFLKFGAGRASAIASLHVRRGLYSREHAMQLVREREGKFPFTYLGVPIEVVLSDLDMSMEDFEDICDAFTNRDVFQMEGEEFVRDQRGELVKVNYDNEVMT